MHTQLIYKNCNYSFDGRTWSGEQWAALHRPQKERFQWLYDDGGRADSGHRGHTGDCVCRAIAIATQQPYEQVYKMLNNLCKPFRKTPRSRSPSCQFGIPNEIYEPFLIEQGWQFCKLAQQEQFNARHVPREGCTIVPMRRHICTVKNGVIRDNHDCSEGGTVWIKGYWRMVQKS